jgi:hypothetical protein
MTVTITHCGSSLPDTYLHLLNASGARLDYNDDYSGTGQCSTPYHSFLQKVLTAGTYYIVSEGYSQNGVIVTNISGVSSQVNTTGNTMQNPIVAGSFSSSFQYVNSQNTTGFTSNYGRSSNDVFYRFTLNATMTVTIKHCNSSISDTYLYLLDASGNLINSNDDYSGEGQCSSTYHSYIKRSLPAGVYYAVSEGYNANGVIMTSIAGEALPPNPTGNTMQNPIVTGSFSSSFQYVNSQNTTGFTSNYGQPSNDVFYRFTLNTTMTVTIKHCNSSISDTYLYLLDASGNLINANDDYSGEGQCSNTYHSYIKRSLPAGVYYAVSEGYSTNGVILTSITGEAAQPNPTGNTMPNAIVAGTYSSAFQYSNLQNTSGFTNNYTGRATNDVFYRFTLNTAMTVTVSHCGSSLSDTYLHLLDASGNLIESDDDYSGTGQCSNTLHSLIKRTLNAGVYYVVSEGYSANGVILTSIMGETSQPNPMGNTMQNPIVAGTFGTAFQYSNSQNTTGFTNNYNGRSTSDVFYRFTLNTAMTVTISHCNSTLSDTYLHLLNASGSLIESNDNYSGEGQCSNTYNSFIKKSLPAGTYYAVSEGYSANGVIMTTVRGEIFTRLLYGYDASGNRIQRSQAASLLSAEKEPEKEKDPEKGKDPEAGKEDEKMTEFGKPEENTEDNSLRETGSPSGSMTVGGIRITVYPNPTKGQVNIEIRDYSDSRPGEIRLYNPTGALLYKEEIRSATTVMDMTGYLSGLYLLNIRYNGEAVSWKIIKN